MPFQNHGNRSFTSTSIDQNAPAASGVYGLANAQQWIYIGETGDIHAELRRHLQNREALANHAPSGFTFELSAAADRSARRDQLLNELRPAANRASDSPR